MPDQNQQAGNENPLGLMLESLASQADYNRETNTFDVGRAADLIIAHADSEPGNPNRDGQINSTELVSRIVADSGAILEGLPPAVSNLDPEGASTASIFETLRNIPAFSNAMHALQDVTFEVIANNDGKISREDLIGLLDPDCDGRFSLQEWPELSETLYGNVERVFAERLADFDAKRLSGTPITNEDLEASAGDHIALGVLQQLKAVKNNVTARD